MLSVLASSLAWLDEDDIDEDEGLEGRPREVVVGVPPDPLLLGVLEVKSCNRERLNLKLLGEKSVLSFINQFFF